MRAPDGGFFRRAVLSFELDCLNSNRLSDRLSPIGSPASFAISGVPPVSRWKRIGRPH